MRKVIISFICLVLLSAIILCGCSKKKYGIDTPSDESADATTMYVYEPPTPAPRLYTYKGIEYEVYINVYDSIEGHEATYDNADEIEAKSDLVVIGKFLDEVANYGSRTANKFQISKVLYGEIDTDIITISQYYYFDDDTNYMYSETGQAPLEPGTEWICFLDEKSHTRAEFEVVGGAYGRWPYFNVTWDEIANHTPEEIGLIMPKKFNIRVFRTVLEKYNIEF